MEYVIADEKDFERTGKCYGVGLFRRKRFIVNAD